VHVPNRLSAFGQMVRTGYEVPESVGLLLERSEEEAVVRDVAAKFRFEELERVGQDGREELNIRQLLASFAQLDEEFGWRAAQAGGEDPISRFDCRCRLGHRDELAVERTRGSSHGLLRLLYALESLQCDLQLFVGGHDEHFYPTPFDVNRARALIANIVALGVDLDPERG